MYTMRMSFISAGVIELKEYRRIMEAWKDGKRVSEGIENNMQSKPSVQ